MALLKYAPFTACKRMENAARSAPPLRQGDRGAAVQLLQGGLIQLGIPLHASTAKGMPDGIYGSETYDAIRKYQTRKHLKNDGVAGKETILAMDLDLVAASKLPPIVLPKPPVVSDPEYQLGISDPLRRHDPGAGAWNSKPKEASYIALKAAIIDALPLAYGVIGDDAVKHMFHYLFNTGLGYTIDLEGMVREVPSAKIRYEDEVVQAKMFVEKLPPDRYEITSKDGELGYNTQHENKNWYFAIGGYTSWGKGVVVVSRQAL